jgi:hypothetical protein
MLLAVIAFGYFSLDRYKKGVAPPKNYAALCSSAVICLLHSEVCGRAEIIALALPRTHRKVPVSSIGSDNGGTGGSAPE